MYQFLGHCDLDLISRIILQEYISYIYYLREESQNWCMDASLDADMFRTILGHCLSYDLVSRIIVSGAFLLYYLM